MTRKKTSAAARPAKLQATFELGTATFVSPPLTEDGRRKRPPRCTLKVRHTRDQAKLLEFLRDTPDADLEVRLYSQADMDGLDSGELASAGELWSGIASWHRMAFEAARERDEERGIQHGVVSFDLVAESHDPAELVRLVAARAELCAQDTFDAYLELVAVQPELPFEGEEDGADG